MNGLPGTYRVLFESPDPELEPVAGPQPGPLPIPGDADGDGVVDFSDFLILSSNFGREVEDGIASADFDNNGVVDFVDFLMLSENFGREL